MASNSRRDRRPESLARLRSSSPPWMPADDPAASSDPVVERHGDPPGLRDRSAGVGSASDDDVDDLDSIAAPPRPVWTGSTHPAWLDGGRSDHPVADAVMAQADREDHIRRRSTRRGPAVAPPAAIALVCVGVLACIVTAYTVFRGPSDDSPTAARVAFPASAGAAAPTTGSPSTSSAGTGPSTSVPVTPVPPTDEVVVSVVGLVRAPGLVRLSGAARVADAIDRAGGGRPGADLLSLNMAQPVRDGDQILVGFADPAGGARMRSAVVSAGATAAAPSSSGASTGGAGAPGASADGAPVNLNTADEAALDTLPGVGPVTAQAIIDWRTRNGRFTSVDQLAEVDGIGPGRLTKLRDRVTV